MNSKTYQQGFVGVGTGETKLSRVDNFTYLVVTFSFETVSFCLPAGLKLVAILLPPGPHVLGLLA